MNANWPALPLNEWRGTYATLHMWTQIVGKVCLAMAPHTNQYWGIAFQVDVRGLSTPLLPYQERAFTMRFNFVEHRLEILCSDGSFRQVPLEQMSVAEFYVRVMDELAVIGIKPKIWTMPVEVPDPIRFTLDTVHREYDPKYAYDFWRTLVAIKPVLEEFRSEFIGKCSPVHFFWGSFDLAVTRFSGRAAPPRPEMGTIYANAYSHEVISHGFWPGSGPVQEAAFYAYIAPAPNGFSEAAVEPADAHFQTELGEFVLPYDTVRTAPSPERHVRSFLETTYTAAASLAAWNREELEKPRRKRE